MDLGRGYHPRRGSWASPDRREPGDSGADGAGPAAPRRIAAGSDSSLVPGYRSRCRVGRGEAPWVWVPLAGRAGRGGNRGRGDPVRGGRLLAPGCSPPCSLLTTVENPASRDGLKSRPPNQIGRVISLEDWALILHLHLSEGLSQRAIARKLSIARDTVASALANDGPPKYERASSPSAISEVEPRIRALLSAYPTMPATVIAERVGWTGSISWFRERVRAIRPEYLPADPVDRLEHPPGLALQCDLWFPAPKIAVGFGQRRCCLCW